MRVLTPDTTILGLLARKTQHGYQLLEAFHDPQRLGSVWKLSTSQLYAVLKRLERQGWISGCEQESENAPPRVEYSLTPQGQSKLHHWLNDPAPSASIRHIRVEFLSRLFVAQSLRYSAQSIIDHQRAVCLAEYLRLKNAQEGSPSRFSALAAKMVLAQLEAVLDWIDHCERMIADPMTEEHY
ncbi:MAG: PadR family transcriptional regulator [Anaerolinea sp.]|nr:PadR family transcriptional regulator [Anaerolinea sp.]MCC6976181.1 PadR family transcriptional regulator [Anaerolineae bacterium]